MCFDSDIWLQYLRRRYEWNINKVRLQFASAYHETVRKSSNVQCVNVCECVRVCVRVCVCVCALITCDYLSFVSWTHLTTQEFRIESGHYWTPVSYHPWQYFEAYFEETRHWETEDAGWLDSFRSRPHRPLSRHFSRPEIYTAAVTSDMLFYIIAGGPSQHVLSSFESFVPVTVNCDLWPRPSNLTIDSITWSCVPNI